MARPDIAVPVAATLFFISALLAFERANFFWWAATGFWAATTATSHLVAWSVIPAAIVTWITFAILHRSNRKILRSSFLGFSIGGLSGALLYLYMMGFRVADLLSFVSYVNQHVYQLPYFSSILERFRMAWSAAGFTLVLGWSGQIAALLVILFSFKLDFSDQKRILGLLLAPTLTAIFYILSFGVYKSLFHPAYGMLAYATSFWTLGAVFSALSYLLFRSLKNYQIQRLELGLNLAACVILLTSVIGVNSITPSLEKAAAGAVAHSDYQQQVLQNIPAGAYVWGTLHFGLGSGVRTQWIDSNSALALKMHVAQNAQSKIEPDYIVLSYYTLESYLRAGPFAQKDSPLAFLPKYYLVRIVTAPPYGNTFIYKKTYEPLTVAANDGASPAWKITTGEPLRFHSNPSTAVQINGATAQSSVRIELNRGVYLVKAKIPKSAMAQTGAVVASPSLTWTTSENLRIAHAPLFREQTEAVFTVDHIGGPVFFSYFPGRAGSKTSKEPLRILSIQEIGNTTNQINDHSVAQNRIQELLSCATSAHKPGKLALECAQVNDESLRLIDSDLSTK